MSILLDWLLKGTALLCVCCLWPFWLEEGCCSLQIRQFISVLAFCFIPIQGKKVSWSWAENFSNYYHYTTNLTKGSILLLKIFLFNLALADFIWTILQHWLFRLPLYIYIYHFFLSLSPSEELHRPWGVQSIKNQRWLRMSWVEREDWTYLCHNVVFSYPLTYQVKK